MSKLQLTDEQRKDLYLSLVYGLAYKSYLIAHRSDLTNNYEPYVYNRYNLEMLVVLVPNYIVGKYIVASNENEQLLTFSELHARFIYHANKIQDIISVPDFRSMFDYLKTMPKTEIPNDLSEFKILKAKYEEWKVDMFMKYGFDFNQFPSYHDQIRWYYSLQLHDLHTNKQISVSAILLAKIN